MYKYRNIYLSIYLSFYLSFDLSICIFLHFKENRAVCPLVALLYVRRYVCSCCLFRMSLNLIFPLAFCLLLQNLVSSALSCLCVFLKLYLCPGWCVAISVLSHAISVLSLCYLCAIYAISGGGQCFDLCYLCAISVLSLCYLCYLMLGRAFCSVLSLCYLCAIYAISCYLCAISVLSL